MTRVLGAPAWLMQSLLHRAQRIAERGFPSVPTDLRGRCMPDLDVSRAGRKQA
jgi:hypothetical protein